MQYGRAPRCHSRVIEAHRTRLRHWIGPTTGMHLQLTPAHRRSSLYLTNYRERARQPLVQMPMVHPGHANNVAQSRIARDNKSWKSRGYRQQNGGNTFNSLYPYSKDMNFAAMVTGKMMYCTPEQFLGRVHCGHSYDQWKLIIDYRHDRYVPYHHYSSFMLIQGFLEMFTRRATREELERGKNIKIIARYVNSLRGCK